MQVVHVEDDESVDYTLSIAPSADALLLDSGRLTAPVRELGGTGRTHDWSLSRRIRDRCGIPGFLAGGLHEFNAAASAVLRLFRSAITSMQFQSLQPLADLSDHSHSAVNVRVCVW